MKPSYRADIDGMRAIAVLAVLLYHLNITGFSGGFVGVDIFFVISGYLITTIILREIDENGFSIARFYERRIRRIFPALFTVILVTLLACGWLFSANEFQQFGQSLIATTLFGSNILFWTQSGYFDGPSTLKPLLHTWSLAVEEQFYIFFPLLLIFIARYVRSKLNLILMAIALASLAWNVYVLSVDNSAAFYLAHLRVWELLIGSLLATKMLPTNIGSRIANLLGLLGLGMLVLPIVLYSNATPFPGFAGLVPTLGAGLIIHSGSENKTLAARLLSLAPIVFIGQISYSLYLWHWPMIVLAKYYAITELKTWEVVAILLGVFAISIISWQWIEKPFRQRAFLKGRTSVFGFAAIVMGLALVSGAIIHFNNGLPNRFASGQINDNPNANPQLAKWKRCDITGKEILSPLNPCKIGKPANAPTFLLWGDSHARAVAPSIQLAALRAGATGVVATTPACPALLGVDRQGRHICSDFNNNVIDYIQAHPNLKTIILASRWALSTQGTRYKVEEGDSVKLVNLLREPTAADTNATLFKLGLDQTVDRLLAMGKKVVIVTQIPEVGYDVPSAFFIAQRTNRDVNQIIGPLRNDYIERNAMDRAVIDELVKNGKVQTVEPWKNLCGPQSCIVVSNGQSLYIDDDHLSIFGAQYLSGIFDTIFKNPVGQ